MLLLLLLLLLELLLGIHRLGRGHNGGYAAHRFI